MKKDGINLTVLSSALSPVAEEYNERPIHSIDNLSTKSIVQDGHNGDADKFIQSCHRIPKRFLDDFSFEELCKINQSSIFMASTDFQHLFENEACYETVRKIRNSMWRWEFHNAGWNETVSAYQGIRRFSLGLNSKFDVRLDYTTGCNEKGLSKYSRTFLDGVFAFLVYYQGEHVMTIGFSFLSEEKIILQQVQLTSPKGNRWLYALPSKRLPFVIDRMKAAFPTHTIYLVEGNALVNDILANDKRSLQDNIESRKKYRRYVKQSQTEEARESSEDSVRRYHENILRLISIIRNLESDRKRLTAFYNETGHHQLEEGAGELSPSYRLVA